MNKDLQTMIEKLNREERGEVLNFIEQMNKQRKASDVAIGDTFFIGKYEFIKFAEANGQMAVVTKNVISTLKFGKNNNFAESDILKNLENGFLNEIADLIGEENIIAFETDLLALDGTDDYKGVISRVSLPTLDFYRKNRKIFDKHKLDVSYWLSTPDSCNNSWVLCVSPAGFVINNNYFSNNGVRPFCIFNSNIFVS